MIKELFEHRHNLKVLFIKYHPDKKPFGNAETFMQLRTIINKLNAYDQNWANKITSHHDLLYLYQYGQYSNPLLTIVHFYKDFLFSQTSSKKRKQQSNGSCPKKKVTKTCKICQKVGTSKICSDECRLKSQKKVNKTQIQVCIVCQKSFETKTKNIKICSDACRLKKKRPKKEPQEILCLVCNQLFIPKSRAGKICSDPCRRTRQKSLRK